eukprot:GDKK01036498.1.p1 GENE.GDKK01036498.1~~GDKK01036498.1.p1  ORF type:complete len:183 (+),score=8.43 GDKK01036498.1:2-550(+)
MGSERAQRAPVQHNVTAGSSVPDANNNNGITPQVGGIPTQQYDYKNTLASTYFTQGDDRTRALIFSASNQFHRWLSYALGVAAYSFGSAMHVYGQGTALSTLTMTAAGTCFFLNAQNRQVNGPTKDIFMFECLGSWLWMLASFQQFSTLKKMRYAGYSSWSGLAATVYFSARYLVAVQKAEE